MFKALRIREILASLALTAVITASGGSIVLAQAGSPGQRGLVRGQEAIQRLGMRLPEVAARLGQTPDGLRRVFETDSSLWVDEAGELLYIDEHTVDGSSAAVEPSEPEAVAPFPLDQTFLLNSKPGSKRVIFLDFDGHVTSGTSWNSSFTGGADIVTPAFDLDGIPSSFNATEAEIVQRTWLHVAEDYAAFDVNVTTQDPGAAAITRSTTSDDVYGTRSVIGPDTFYGAAGGVAYVGTFDSVGDSGKPNFVFTNNLGNGSSNAVYRAKLFAEAASHEVGHNLGLSHDGKNNADGTTSAYYYGHNGWAPIMGVGYNQAVTHWSNGDYSGANQTQDDYVVMASNGVLARTDDHGNATGAATAISTSAVNVSGIIETRADVDHFRFTTGSGTINLTLTGPAVSPNVDISAQILDSNGVVVATSNPTGLNASFNTPLSSGTYFLRVEGVGEGDLVTGYSDYGSTGQYFVTGTLVSAGQPIADAVGSNTTGVAPLNVGFTSTGSSDPDGSIVSYAWNFGDGGTSTDPNPSYTYNKSGNFTATLTVTDNSGFSSTDTVAVSVTNTAPIAAASANVTSGPASLAVGFSSVGSSDADGNIASYLWNFGNGATSTAANPTYTYTTAGTYSATVRVTDNLGASTTSAPVVITVTAPVRYSYVSAMTISRTVDRKGNASATVTVTVRGSDGAAKANAVVAGSWSGLTSANVSGTTNRSGQVSFKSATTSATSGTFTFTVNGITLTGFPYDSTKNVRTSISINR